MTDAQSTEQHGVRCVFCGFDKTVCICGARTADERNAPIEEIIASIRARKELCESADVYGWAADRLVDEIERLKAYIEDILTKDRLKTREINILTPENRKLRATMRNVAGWLNNGCDPARGAAELLLVAGLPDDVQAEPKPCEHLRSELLAEKRKDGEPVFEMRKCLDCEKAFRVRRSVTRT